MRTLLLLAGLSLALLLVAPAPADAQFFPTGFPVRSYAYGYRFPGGVYAVRTGLPVGPRFGIYSSTGVYPVTYGPYLRGYAAGYTVLYTSYPYAPTYYNPNYFNTAAQQPQQYPTGYFPTSQYSYPTYYLPTY